MPNLRRLARALTGGQGPGDAAAAATLQRIIGQPARVVGQPDTRVALFRQFYLHWSDAGREVADPAAESDPMVTAAQSRLRQLGSTDRVAYLLHGLEGMSDDQIASILDLDAGEAAAKVSSGRDALTSLNPGRIMIIEDEPMIATDLASIVSGMDHDVVGITDTRTKAVAMATQEHPNLVLADLRLADGLSGIDAADEIQSIMPVPVVFITAFPELLLTGERPEPAFLIAKPFESREVESATAQALFFGSAAAPA